LTCLAFALWAPRLAGPLDLRFDAGVYYITGTALAEGKGYRLLNEPGEIEAIQYPPGLPLMVAGFQRVLGTSDPAIIGRWLRITYCALFLLYVPLVYLLACQYLRQPYALLAALGTTISQHTYFLSDLLFAELPFAVAGVGFVLCLQSSGKLSRYGGSSVLAVLAYSLRAAGIALLAAWIAQSLFARRWKEAAFAAAVSLALVVSWQTYVANVKASPEYEHPAYAYQRAPYQFYNVTYFENILLADPFTPQRGLLSAGAMVARVGRNLLYAPLYVGEVVTASHSFWETAVRNSQHRAGIDVVSPQCVAIPIYVAGAVALLGLAILFVRGITFVPLYIAATLAMVSVTPWPEQMMRYLTPMIPFIAIVFGCGVSSVRSWCASRPGSRVCRGLSLAATGMMVMALGVESANVFQTFRHRWREGATVVETGERTGPRLFYYGPKWAAFDRSLVWLQEHAVAGTTLATTHPQRAYMMTGLKAIMPPYESDPAEAQRMLDAVPIEYVVVDNLDELGAVRDYAARCLATNRTKWREVYVDRSGGTIVYQRLKADR
jgi:hypothetical protein